MNPIVPPGEGKPSSSPMSIRLPEALKKRIDRISKETRNSKHETVLHLLRWAADAYDKSREAERAAEGQQASQ